MKKNLYSILTLIMVLAVSLFTFAGCEIITDSSSSNNADKPCSILVSDNDKVVIAVNVAKENQTLFDVMTSLKNENFDFKYKDGPYGAFITEVNGRKPVGADYWAIYTSDTENGNADYGTYEYNGQTLVSASFGVSGLKVKPYATYALVYNHVADSEIKVSDNDKVVIAVNVAKENQTLFDVMTSLKNENFDFKYEDGPYGAFITEVNGRKPVGADYWAIYTSDTENGNADYGTYEYNGQTLVSASFGVSGLKVKPYATYALVYTHGKEI